MSRLIYIIEDNGVYGLTKGQFSATADIGSKLKTGVINDLPPIDTCSLAIQLGATFVGRSFSGDKKQLLAMLKAAIAHNGTVVLDVISPCVTFNDHEGSTRSYKYMQEHEEAISEVGFVPHFQEIDVEYDPGTTINVEMHDGSHLRLRKLHEEYDPTDRIAAISALMSAHAKEEVLTGIFYIDTQKPSFTEMLNLVDEPLGTLPDERVRPGRAGAGRRDATAHVGFRRQSESRRGTESPGQIVRGFSSCKEKKGSEPSWIYLPLCSASASGSGKSVSLSFSISS